MQDPAAVPSLHSFRQKCRCCGRKAATAASVSCERPCGWLGDWWCRRGSFARRGSSGDRSAARPARPTASGRARTTAACWDGGGGRASAGRWRGSAAAPAAPPQLQPGPPSLRSVAAALPIIKSVSRAEPLTANLAIGGGGASRAVVAGSLAGPRLHPDRFDANSPNAEGETRAQPDTSTRRSPGRTARARRPASVTAAQPAALTSVSAGARLERRVTPRSDTAV
mmetsp:Transcript_34971/g.112695  ORF Transcript_34971/g.112695 Transcript_34971/m.112695 type:complete len:225 (-) Transcript_34971:27-701(-)|eukprot:scaffold3418_cov124-Isochrysis_galbana.AAC.12